MLRARLVASFMVLQAATALAVEQPYFRFGLGSETAPAGGPGSGGTGTNPDTGTGTPANSLAFASATPIASGGTGDPRAGSYAASGGEAPYTMTLVDAPPSLVLAKASQDGSAYALTGDLGPAPGTFRSARIVLRDAKSAAVAYAVPLDVLSLPDRPGPAAPSITAEDFPASFNAGVRTYANASVTGGTAPYTWTLENAPASVVVAAQAGSPVNASVQAYASVSQPGVYQGVVLTVTDAAGMKASKTFSPFEVKAFGSGNAIAIGAIEAPPARMPPGTTWTSAPFTVSGGDSGAFDVWVEAGPSSGAFKADSLGGNSYRLTFAPTQADIGRYGGLMVVARDKQGTPDAIAPVGATTVPGPAPLALTDQGGPLNVDPGDFTPVRYGGFTGGSGTYTVEGFGGLPDFSFYFAPFAQPAASGNGAQDILAYVYGTGPGVHRDLLITVTDSKTGERLTLNRFDVTVGNPTAAPGGPIVACETYWGYPAPMTLNVEDTLVNGDAIRISGGQAPFSVSYDASAVAGGMGFALNPGTTIALASGKTGLQGTFRPTAPGRFTDLAVTVRDSAGSTCVVRMSALANPKGTGY